MTDSSDSFVVITANLLREGKVVYRRDSTHREDTGDDADNRDDGAADWTADIDAATVYSGDQATDALREAEADPRVVSAYAAEIAGRRNPISARERIRAEGGPTVKYGENALAPEAPDFSI